MPQISKFGGHLVRQRRACSVVTPAYDAMTPAQRRTFAGRHPGNYVNVMRSLDEFDEYNKPTLEEVLAHNRSHLRWLLDGDAFARTPHPAYYLYQLKCRAHEQTGLIANIPVADYTEARLKKHEDTQRQKEDMLVRYQDAVGVASSPICVAYADRAGIDDAVRQAKTAAPCLKFSAWDTVEQTVWRIDDAQIEQALADEFAQVEYTYLTDGHHRCASGARFAELVRKRSAAASMSLNAEQLLVALFPQSQLKIYSYFRCVRDLGGMSIAQLVSAIEGVGIEVEQQPIESDQLLPQVRRQITMIAGHRAFRLRIPDALVPERDPVGCLDVSILQNKILAPVLNIGDARGDDRLSYVPGVGGISVLRERCSSDWQVGFACVDTKIEEVIEVADAAQTMPPKSTWFDPKLRAGIFLRQCV